MKIIPQILQMHFNLRRHPEAVSRVPHSQHAAHDGREYAQAPVCRGAMQIGGRRHPSRAVDDRENWTVREGHVRYEN